MTQAEYMAWREFHKFHPFDDYARLYRPAALIASLQTGADVNDLLAWLEPKPVVKGLSSIDMATLKAFGLKPPGS